MTIAIRGNDEDEKIVERFFDMIIANMNEVVRLNRYRVDGSAPPSGVTLPEAAAPDATAADIDDGTVAEGEERASAAPEDPTAE